MKPVRLFFLPFLLLLSSLTRAQDQWPKTVNASDGSIIRVYEPQPESFKGNVLKGRAAFSVSHPGDTAEPVFGTFWAVATVETDKDARTVRILSVNIPNLRFARDSSENTIKFLRTELESGLGRMNLELSLDMLLANLDISTEEKSLSKGLSTTPPNILYRSQPSLLVLIDGQPMLQKNKDWGVDVIVNTPYTIVKDDHYYLYGAHHWYVASEATGPYTYTSSVPNKLNKVQRAVDDAHNTNAEYEDSAVIADTVISQIIVSTTPAELIQSAGDAVFTPIPGTGLSYIANSNNDIFRDSTGGRYYVLLSGRWYTSSQLQSGWQYIGSDALPPGFARIPEGSPKDNVLASIAGTPAAREAILDAQIPQTTRVDRHNPQADDVTYDGNPQFEAIAGTHLQYAVNSPDPVILSNNQYYSVDDGVWYVSNSPNGPWQVCTARPADVDLIPPTCPIYNVKYVDIYDADPDWVYEGYTPGYLDSYIFGPTVVYGTGFYYTPWRGHFFYPRPWTWGFNFWYDPWMGWTFGYDYDWDWYNWDLGFGLGLGFGLWYGGWWGPYLYRPAYAGWGFYHHGFYGRNSYFVHSRYFHNTNIYRERQDVFNRGNGRITTDREGNVFRRDGQGGWQQRQNGAWRPLNNEGMRQNLERQEQLHNRGTIRANNFQLSHGSFGGFRGGGFRGGGGFHGGGSFHGGGGRR